MDQTETLLVTAVCLFGTALGLRYHVYVLIPAGVAVLITSAGAQLIWKKMAGWGVSGTLALLIALNTGFVVGLFLRAGAAFWYTHKIGRLFAGTVHADQSPPGSDGTARDESSEGAGTPDTIATRSLAKEGFSR